MRLRYPVNAASLLIGDLKKPIVWRVRSASQTCSALPFRLSLSSVFKVIRVTGNKFEENAAHTRSPPENFLRRYISWKSILSHPQQYRICKCTRYSYFKKKKWIKCKRLYTTLSNPMESRDQNLNQQPGGPLDGSLAAADEDVKRKKLRRYNLACWPRVQEHLCSQPTWQ